MGRSPCCSKVGLRRGPWSTKEDTLLTNYIQEHGEGQWRSLPKEAGLLRCGKSCRLRWMNYLRPGIKRGNISEDEEDLIVRLHGLLGNRWSLIAGRLPGRTDNEIKNYWNTHLLKKLKTAGIDLRPPVEERNKVRKRKQQKQEEAEAAAAAPEEERNKVRKRKQQKKKEAEAAAAAPEEKKAAALPEIRAKAYLPKPVRVSSEVVFLRTESYESLTTTVSSSSEAAAVASEGMAWPPPLFELEDGGEQEDDYFLDGGGYMLPLLRHPAAADVMSGDVEMLERVYDEYLQLL